MDYEMDHEQIIQTMRILREEYPEEKRHPLVADSQDWYRVKPVLAAIEGLLSAATTPTNKVLLMTAASMLRVTMETLYVMGIERGRNEDRNPFDQWIVKEQP